ncbi:hypothetical protein AX15_001287 [Amanita polypyramis BW_CC]|nr:hypothetical protein AX15_001287 [Amanita polypyramis BW_CC]
MPFASLPLELVSHILAYLSTHHLLPLITADIRLSHLALRLLYRDLHVSSNARNLSVVVTLAKKPPLAAHVRSFALHIEPSAVLFRSFYDALRAALSNMSALTSLRLFLNPTFSSALRAADGSIFSDLLNVSMSLAHGHNLALCLAKADSLLGLDLESLPDSPELPVGPFPHVGKFTDPVRVAEIPIPSHSVDTIRLSSGNILESVTAKLAESAVPVVLFEANIDSLSIPSLLSLSQAMPCLQYVRFTTTSNSIEPPSDEFCEDVAKTLSFFPSLESFELWGVHFEQRQRGPNNCGCSWKAKMFSPSPSFGELQPPDLFSDDFMVY